VRQKFDSRQRLRHRVDALQAKHTPRGLPLALQESVVTSPSPIEQTRRWVDHFVVEHNICPFARRDVQAERVRYTICDLPLSEALEQLIAECQSLDANSNIETTLMICIEHFADFDDFLDLIALGEALLQAQGYEGVYQLAHFHPDYCFEGVEADDPANYSNRSPLPTLHLIREASLARVLESVDAPERIPERNIEYLRQLGSARLETLLDSCRQPD
jgi:hypothetical protein